MIYQTSLFITMILFIVGSFMKIQHYTYANDCFSLALITSIVFVFLGLRDAFQDKTNDSIVKMMWLVGFVFFSWLTGLLYYRSFKKKN